MASLKAIIVMLIFSGAVMFGMSMAGLHETHSDPSSAAIGAVVLLVALIVNVTIYLKVAGEAPFKWFND